MGPPTIRGQDRFITERFGRRLGEELAQARTAGDADRAASIERRIAQAVVVLRDEIMTQRVQFGTRVTVFAIEEAEEQTVVIVSDDEADVAAGLLGQSAPLARALLGAQEGDEVVVTLPNGSECVYEVTSITLP